MKLLSLFFWCIVCVFVYQNCGSPSPPLSIDQPAINQSVDKASLGGVDLDQPLSFRVSGYKVVLNPSTGHIVDSENKDWISLCLEQDIKDSLIIYLSNNSICESHYSRPDDQVCTLIYKSPYIEVFSSDQSAPIAIGEELNGCPETKVHFCTNNEEIKKIITQLTFPQNLQPCP